MYIDFKHAKFLLDFKLSWEQFWLIDWFSNLKSENLNSSKKSDFFFRTMIADSFAYNKI